MPSTISQTQIVNLALGKMGAQPISDITDLNSPAAAAANNFWETDLRSCLRKAEWSFAKTRVFPPAAPVGVNPPNPAFPNQPTNFTQWAPNTFFAANSNVVFAGTYYQALIDHTSSSNFINDLTAGDWFQYVFPGDIFGFDGGGGTLYPWTFAYGLPNDFVRIVELSGQPCWEANGELYEIVNVQISSGSPPTLSNMQVLFCDDPAPSVEYIRFMEDTTLFDPLFVEAFSTLLASSLATVLRKDDGRVALELRQSYKRDFLPGAQVKDAGERKLRRFQPVLESKFVASRYRSTNS